MEILNEILAAIGQVGFPIVCVFVMFVQMEKERERHREESAEWVKALNDNTAVLEKLLERM